MRSRQREAGLDFAGQCALMVERIEDAALTSDFGESMSEWEWALVGSVRQRLRRGEWLTRKQIDALRRIADRVVA